MIILQSEGENMRTAYLAISYKCNQHCSFCPCSKEESMYPFVEMENIMNTAENFVKMQGVDTIVISGGEPTLHPRFMEIIEFITKKLNCSVTVLSNGEKYRDKTFIEKIKRMDIKEKYTAITTIHSQNAEEHERINGSKGSFSRSIAGLKMMEKIGVNVIIKHCITVTNYKELAEFYKFIDGEFEDSVNIQLCSIDYCGIEEKDLEKNKLSFVSLKPYLERMFDLYVKNCQKGSARYMYAINMPFCACDPYYWEFLTPKAEGYSAYASPDDSGDMVKLNQVDPNVDTFGGACQECKVKEICPGTYKTAFEYYGDTIIAPYE